MELPMHRIPGAGCNRSRCTSHRYPSGSVSEAEVLSLLLSNGNTRESIREVASDWNHHRTIALGEFVWVGVSLNGCCKFLSRSQVEVFDVVSPDWSWLRTRWLLGNSGKTIPCGR